MNLLEDKWFMYVADSVTNLMIMAMVNLSFSLLQLY